jgi:glycosyltransferase involved in cell wall biosynthesis
MITSVSEADGLADRAITVSVLVMTYNHIPFISQALDSVLMQRVRFPYEVLISEDCS